MEILLIHPGGLGDVILALPAIALLRDKFPSARLTIAANLDHVAPIVGAFVERAVSLSALPLHNLYSENSLPPADVRFWRSFDRIISWTGAGDAGFVRRMKEAHPNVCIASWRPAGPQEQRHVAQLFVDSLGSETASGMKAVPRIISLGSGLSAQGFQWLRERKWNIYEPLIAMHPGAGSKGKRWPLTRFISLAERLVAQQNKLLIIEGPAEPGFAAQIARELPAGAAIAAPLSLDILAAVIMRSKAFLGNDSGIAHLAAALGIPSIVIFGPTLPQHWAPLGPNVRVLRDCSGCEACLSGGDSHTCLDNITVEDVIRNLKFDSPRTFRKSIFQKLPN